MAEEEVQKLRFVADLGAVESASRTLRRYIQDTVAAVKAVGDFNAVELRMASSAKLADDTVRASFTSQSSARIAELRAKTDTATKGMESLRASIESVKDELDDPSFKEALGDVGKSSGGGLAAGRQFLGAAGSVAGRVSPEAGAAIGTASGLIEASKELPRFKEALAGISPTSIAAGGALGIASGALLLIRDNAQKVAEAARSELDTRERAFQLIATGTSQEIEDRLKALDVERQAKEGEKARALQFYSDLRDGIRQQFGDAGLALADFNDALGTNNTELGEARKRLDDANKALSTTNTEEQLLTQFRQQGTATTADAVAQEKSLADARKAQIAFGLQVQETLIQGEIRIAELRRTGTEEQLQGAEQVLQDQMDAYNNAIAQLKLNQQVLEPGGVDYQQLGDQIKKYQDRVFELGAQFDQLANSTLANEIKLRAAVQKQEEINTKSAASYEKFINDVTKIDDTSIQARIAATAKYNKTLVDIAEQAAESAENALNNLIQKRGELTAKFAQDETDAETKAQIEALDDQIKFQRESAQSARNHQRDLQKILRDSQEREQDLIETRDFKGQYDLQRSTKNQIDESNIAYDQQQEDRLEAFAQENEDRSRHFIEEEQARQLNYQRQLAEAQAQYNKERDQAVRARNEALQKAAEANNQELLMISQKHQSELTMRRDAEVAELALIHQSDAAKLALQKQYADSAEAIWRNKINSLANGTSGGSSGGGSITATPFANGGSLLAGQRALVNEEGSSRRESFASGGRSINFPGMGVFTPSQSGTVNPNRGGVGSLNLTINIHGGNEERMANIAEERFKAIMEDYLQ